MTYPSNMTASRPGLMDRIRFGMITCRDWLDERGRFAWFVAIIAGFIFVWPIGLALLLYMIGSNRMGNSIGRGKCVTRLNSKTSGNSAFDAYREDTLKRLEEEHEEFLAFLSRLREARDKAEFEQFMTERGAQARQG